MYNESITITADKALDFLHAKTHNAAMANMIIKGEILSRASRNAEEHFLQAVEEFDFNFL